MSNIPIHNNKSGLELTFQNCIVKNSNKISLISFTKILTLKITAGQWSLTIPTAFVTMTGNTQM